MLRRTFLWTASALAFGGAKPAAGPARSVRIYARPQSEAEALDPKTFAVAFDKSGGRVSRVLTPADPQLILVVLDLVGDLGAIEPAKSALIEEIEKLPGSTHVALLRSQDGLTVLLDPTKDRGAAANAIHNLTISGRPGLLETLDPVEGIADAIAQKANVRLSILFVTDGNVADYREDFSNPVINSSDPHDLSRQFPEALIREKITKLGGALAARQTPLHIVQIVYRGDRLNEAYQNGLDLVAAQLGGVAAFSRARAEIHEAISRVFRSIVSEYAVIVTPPGRISPAPAVEVTAGDVPLSFRSRIRLQEK